MDRFRITVYDKTFTRRGWVDDPISLRCVPRHLAIGSADITVAADHRMIPYLAAAGARAVIHHQDEVALSGKIRPWSGSGPTNTGQVVFTVEDDSRLLWNMFGYPSPASYTPDAGGGLTQPDKEDSRTGPAETVVKGFVTANKARWSLPITVAASLGRGSTITVAVRMVPLADKLVAALKNSGIGVSVRQSGAGLVVDCYETSLYPLTLSEDGGTVIGWAASSTGPTATRAIIGGPNTGTSREFKLVVDSAREAAYDDIIETLVDAGGETIAAKILAAGTSALAEADSKYSFNVDLTETSAFKYGQDGLHVGDEVAVQLSLGIPPITAVLREAELTWDRNSGYLATLKVGDDPDDPDAQIARLLDELIREVRALKSR